MLVVPFFSFHSRCGSRGPDSDSSGPDSGVCEDSTVLQTQYVTMFVWRLQEWHSLFVHAWFPRVSHGPTVKCRTVEGTQ